MFVKICGITRAEDAQLAAALGATAVGFIFWPRSPRAISPGRARAIVEALPPSVMPVGVFVNQPLDEVKRIAADVALQAVQLHGDESAPYCERLRLPVIKAVTLGATGDFAALDAVPSGCTVLVDAFDPVARGGTGRAADWTTARQIAARRRTILAGGLHAGNIARALEAVSPYGVDVSSGVESAPGIKDEAKLRAFFDALHLSRLACPTESEQ